MVDETGEVIENGETVKNPNRYGEQKYCDRK